MSPKVAIAFLWEIFGGEGFCHLHRQVHAPPFERLFCGVFAQPILWQGLPIPFLQAASYGVEPHWAPHSTGEAAVSRYLGNHK